MCDFCKCENLTRAYTPVKSLIDLQILVCDNCGLVQSSYDLDKIVDNNTFFDKKTQKEEEYKFNHLSCDADYSSQRVGKKQMTPNAVHMIKDLKNVKSVLDICCAKGHFAEAAIDLFNLENIECIDNDPYITKNIKNDKINLNIGKYFTFSYDKKFDLVHSCHILEHESSPSRMISYIHDALNMGGYFYLDVPDIECINDTINIDEFFYDKHFYYFNEFILTEHCKNNGFELVKSRKVNGCLNLLFRKVDEKMDHGYYNFTGNVKKMIDIIEKYKTSINEYRSVGKDVARKINNLTKNKKCLFFGCGRMLDYFYKYCDLNIVTLCDDFVEHFYDFQVYKSSEIDFDQFDHVITFFRTGKTDVKSISIVDYYTNNNK